MELGGKDPAYVRPDCDLKYTVETLVDGSFFNSGQCCCAIERIYVHADIYDAFVAAFVAETKVLCLASVYLYFWDSVSTGECGRNISLLIIIDVWVCPRPTLCKKKPGGICGLA